MTCPHCHAVVADNARFCPACGKASVSTETAADTSGPFKTQNEMIGREVVGRFRILAKLGEGGMGAVYRGEQIALKRAVAIKVMRHELSANQMVLSRFRAEAEAIARLDHPNTVKVYDTGQDTDGSLFIAMEFIDGKSLRQILTQGPLRPARAFNIALQIAASLIDAHSHSIVHRDLKPDNVMLQDKNRQRDVVRVLDFGIAKLRDDSRQTQQQAMTQAGDMLGTPQYMAPEQIKGTTIDGRTDIYALGCLIYEMLTARLPFEAVTVMAMLSKHLTEPPVPPSQRRPDLELSPAIDQVVMMALQKDPAVRPPTMEQYADMLAGVLRSLPPDPMYPTANTAIQNVQHTPQPFPQIATPPAFSQAVITPQPYPSPPHPPGYPPGYAQYPPAPSRVPRSQAKSKLPLVLILGSIALVGAGVGVWVATRDSSAAKDDYRAHTDPPPQAHGSSEVPSGDIHEAAPQQSPSGNDPWAISSESAPPPPPQPTPPLKPARPKQAGHEYSCNQIATKGITLATEDLQRRIIGMPAPQIQAAVTQFQQTVTQAYMKILDDCNTRDYSDVSRACVMNAHTLAVAAKCQ